MNSQLSEHQSDRTSIDFNRLVRPSSRPTLVIFENSWSKALIPGIDQLAKAFRGRLRIVRLNLATHHELAAHLKIRVVPTLLFFKGGALVEFMVGPVPVQFIAETVANTHLHGRRLLQATHGGRRRKPTHPAAGNTPSGKHLDALVV